MTDTLREAYQKVMEAEEKNELKESDVDSKLVLKAQKLLKTADKKTLATIIKWARSETDKVK